jgi:hypothetical protein
MPNTVSIDEKKVEGSYPADNNLHVGNKAVMTTNFGTGMAGASFGMYGISIGNGDAGSWGVHDIVGVHGTAIKNGKHWAAGMHCDVYDSVPGGTAIGLNIEFPQTQVGTDTIGINIQPDENARGLVGLQIQNPKAFKHAMKVPNMNITFGKVDECWFGMRFNPTRQSLEFFRAIGEKDETKVGEIKMDFGQAK